MKVSELIRVLKDAGCYIYRNGANHDIWYSPITKKTFPISRHGSQELRTGTLNSIKKQAGI